MPNKSKFNIVVAAIGGFLIGFDISILFVLKPISTEIFHLNQSLKSLLVLLPVPGYLIGAFTMGLIGNKYSRRFILKILGMIFIISSIGCGIANNFILFFLFQILAGIAIGGTSVIAPVYIAEMAPIKESEISKLLFPIFMALGILSGLSYTLIPIGDIQNLWRWIQFSPVIPSLLLFILLYRSKRSPQWLVTKGLHGEAYHRISEINSRLTGAEVEKVVNGIDKSVFPDNDLTLSKKRFKNELTGIFIAMFFQFSGFLATLFFAPEIFLLAGLNEEPVSFHVTFVAFTVLIGIVVAFLATSGYRKITILITGAFGMFVFLAGLSYSILMGISGFLSVFLMAGFLMCFVFSLGSLIWLILPELFYTKNRIKGVSIAMVSFWSFFAVGFYVLPFLQKSSDYTMGVVFAICGLYSLMSIYFFKKHYFKSGEYLKDELEGNLL